MLSFHEAGRVSLVGTTGVDVACTVGREAATAAAIVAMTRRGKGFTLGVKENERLDGTKEMEKGSHDLQPDGPQGIPAALRLHPLPLCHHHLPARTFPQRLGLFTASSANRTSLRAQVTGHDARSTQPIPLITHSPPIPRPCPTALSPNPANHGLVAFSQDHVPPCSRHRFLLCGAHSRSVACFSHLLPACSDCTISGVTIVLYSPRVCRLRRWLFGSRRGCIPHAQVNISL